MTEKVGKVILTSRSALAAKYGAGGLDQILQAVDRLIAADAGRGLLSLLVELDDPGTMQPLGAPVLTGNDPAGAKAAIDGVYQARVPDYLMILGATDVIPHVPMANPMYNGPDGADPDEFAYGDLPYACEAPYGVDAAAFVGPTRVVGRLPDVVGATDPTYLVGLIDAAVGWETRTRDDYVSYLGMTAKVWTGSTTLSLQGVFGDAHDLQTSPTGGPNWSIDLLGRRSHFINCHGADSDDHFYGQEGHSYPVAHDGKLVDGNVTAGTVVAAECCYGAQLYDPTGVGGLPGLCNIYLGSGAYGFWGSSTIAYGPSDSNGSADYICQFFLTSVLAGASLGRAALEARQGFVQKVTTVDPADLKTLAQYSLLGDPSIHPVQAAHDVVDVDPAAAGTGEKSMPGLVAALAVGREARRMKLAATGLALLASTAVAAPIGAIAAAVGVAGILEQLGALAGEPDLAGAKLMTFRIDPPAVAAQMHAMLTPQPDVLHVAATRSYDDGGPVRIVAVIGRERNGRIVEFRKLFGK
jgi:hypothetical protein